MITYDEALTLVSAAASPLGTEVVTLDRAHGRFLAEPLVAGVDAPPANVSAMDGYAVVGDHSSYPIVGSSYPGAPYGGDLLVGECVRVFTGAAVPAGADRVVVQEAVERDGDRAYVRGPLDGPDFIRRRGADFSIGQRLLAAGDRLTARALVVAAGADLDRVTVGRSPRVRMLATGDELAPAGEARSRPDSIPESVSPGLMALVVEHGAVCEAPEIVPDDRTATIRAAERALAGADVVVVVGGASVGERDFARTAFGAAGIDLRFSGVAMRPGKPVWMGHADGRVVVGLPGNPTSAYVTARLLLAPLLWGLGGGRPADAVRWLPAQLGEGLPPCGGRETFTRAIWREGAAVALPYQDSGSQLTLASAELLVRQAAGTGPLTPGDRVEVLAL